MLAPRAASKKLCEDHRVTVALDATPLTVPTGGVRRYTEELARALAASYTQDQICLISDQKFALEGLGPSNLKSCPGPRSALDKRWWLWGLPMELRRMSADVFHGTDFSVPYLRICATVMTVHDLSPWRWPELQPGSKRVRWRAPLLLRFGRASMIITPSEAVRREVVAHFGLPQHRVRAIPLAAASRFQPAPSRDEPPYLLYVGTLEPRKNIQLLIEAWREIKCKHPVRLVLAGRRREDFPAVPAEPGLEVRGAVPEEELPALYSGAVACLYPSLYEGFGLPVLEAMQCGALVIASTDPAVTEVAANGAVLVPVEDRAGWVEAMTNAITQPEWKNQYRERARCRAADFSWSATAKLTREVYDEAIARFRRTRTE